MARARTDRGERFKQHFGIGFDRRDLDLIEQLWNQLEHHFAIFEHVGDARRRAGVVFQNIEFVGTGAHQIDAGDMRPDAAGRFLANHLQTKAGVLQDQIFRNDAGAENVARAVDIGEKQIECRHPLLEPAFQSIPFAARQNARHDIERDQPLGRIGVAIDGKGDADPAEEQLGLPAACRHQLRRAVIEPALDRPIGGIHFTAADAPIDLGQAVHFVKGGRRCHHRSRCCGRDTVQCSEAAQV